MSAKKSLGQHFLTSHSVIRNIIDAADIEKDDDILEIGPGKGILTRALLDSGARVVSVELDHELIAGLREQFSSEIFSEQLTLIEADILTFDPKEYFEGEYRMVANIPYYITGKILRRFLGATHQPKSVVLLIQKEVAQRIVARDGKESLLSLAVKAYGRPRIVRKVSRGCFNPPPAVDSAVIAIEGVSRDYFHDLSEKQFFTVIKAGFGHKRKKLSNNLEVLYPKNIVEGALSKMEKSENTRAEDLSLEEWRILIGELEKRG